MSVTAKAWAGSRQRTHTRWRRTSSGTAPGAKAVGPVDKGDPLPRGLGKCEYNLATTVWPPPLGTAETSSVSRPAGRPPPSASSIEGTAAETPPHGLRFLSGKRAERSDRSAETVGEEAGTCSHSQ